MSDKIFSLKMRASRQGIHTSGAEKILPAEALPVFMESLLGRAMNHSNGEPDFVNFKINMLNPAGIEHLEALPVRSLKADSPDDGLRLIARALSDLGVGRAPEIVDILKTLRGMRGAALLDAETLERLEPDPARGVRATLMDADFAGTGGVSCRKNHFREALILATKVVNAPNIVAELCISDDPDYVTGYLASRELGYLRISPLKFPGSPAGGRIFLYRGKREKVFETIDYLENRPAVIRGIPDADGAYTLKTRIKETLDDLRRYDLFRVERITEPPHRNGVHGELPRPLVFASNDYLALSADPRVKAAASAACAVYGVGSGGSRLTTGTTPIHRELENVLAEFKGTEAAVLFNSGYAANSGIIPAVCGDGDLIFSDELNHASIIDGCRLSRARTIIYRHNDMADLEAKIRACGSGRGLIVTDGVFSMDGDVVNFPALMALSGRYRLMTMIDEAHANGVLGHSGRGVAEYFGWDGPPPDILVGTLSKAFGSEGGFAAVSGEIADLLRNRARSYIFSTSMPAGSAAAALTAVRILEREPELTERLRRNRIHLLRLLEERGVMTSSESAVIPVIIGDSARVMKIAREMLENGIIVSPIRYPSVPRNRARIRLTVSAAHTAGELIRCADALARALKTTEKV